jgi:glycosyltransferase involved in cell wall biosynthesis
MRILQGMTDIASQAGYSAQGLRALGHEVCCATFTPNMYSAAELDVVLHPDGLPRRPMRWAKCVGFAWKALRRFDAFHFHFGASLLPYNLDIGILRRMDKPVFVEFHGSDLRGGAFWKRNPYARLYPGYDDRARLRKHMCKLARKSTAVIVHDWELENYLPDDVNVYYVPLRLGIQAPEPDGISREESSGNKIFPSPCDAEGSTEGSKAPPRYFCAPADVPLIAHMPSDPAVKGPALIEAILKRLSSTHPFECRSVRQITPHEVQRLLRESTIVIDQVVIGVYGMLAIETMACARPVVSYLREDLRRYYPEDLPVINATIDSLEEVLSELLRDPHRLAGIGRAGRRYVRKYHDCTKVAHLLERIYLTGEGISDALAAYRAVAAYTGYD